MQWNSFQEFWHMGGHGFFVWGSFGSALVIVVAEVLAVRRRRTRTEEELRNHFENQDNLS